MSASRLSPGGDPPALRHSLVSILALGTIVIAPGCVWQVPLDPSLARRVESRLAAEQPLTPEDYSQRPPRSFDDAVKDFDFPKPEPRSDGSAPTPTAIKDVQPMSIAEVRAAALRNNLDLQIVRIDPAIAQTVVSEEEAKFDDLIFARAKYNRKDTPTASGNVVTFKTDDPNSPLKGQTARLTDTPQLTEFLEWEAGISVPLRTGGRMTLSAPFDNKNGLTSPKSDQYRNALRFSFSQPLLRDAGIDANTASIRIARYSQKVVDVKTQLQAIRVLAAMDRAYWTVYYAWSELDVRRQQYENAFKNLELVRRRVAEGLTAAVEINRAQVGVAERMEALIVAETNLKLRQRQLKLLMNQEQLGIETTTLVSPSTPPLLVSFDLDRDRLVSKALAGRLELLELELQLAADLTKIDYLRNQTLPLFLFEYSYGGLGRSESSFGSAFDQAIGGTFYDWSVGVRFEMPLTNEARKSRLERAVQERLQRLTTQQLRELTVKREIYDALDQLNQNWQRILTARQNVIVAGINYDAEQKQFIEGLRTMTEVLEALTRLGEAQIREIRAIVDYQVSLIDLAFATGTLLGYSRVGLAG